MMVVLMTMIVMAALMIMVVMLVLAMTNRMSYHATH